MTLWIVGEILLDPRNVLGGDDGFIWFRGSTSCATGLIESLNEAFKGFSVRDVLP